MSVLKKLASFAFSAAFLVGCAQSKSPDAAAPASGSSSLNNAEKKTSVNNKIVDLSFSFTADAADAKYDCTAKKIKFLSASTIDKTFTNIELNKWYTFDEIESDLRIEQGDSASMSRAWTENMASKKCEGVDVMAGIREQFTKNFEESKEYAIYLFADCKDEEYEYYKNRMESNWSDALAGKGSFIYNQEGLLAGLKEAIKKYPECRLGRFL